MTDQKESWTPGIEYILEEIRENSITVSNYHKDRYYYQKGYLKYFRIPTIILAALNSVFSVGLQPYCPQATISVLCCIISMMCGIISSIELFLSIQATMEKELIASKDFYLLSVDIFKMLYLERETRMVNGKTYLDEIYQTYCKLIENSNLVKTKMQTMGESFVISDASKRIIKNIAENKMNNKKKKLPVILEANLDLVVEEVEEVEIEEVVEEELDLEKGPNIELITTEQNVSEVELTYLADVDIDVNEEKEIIEVKEETIVKPKRKYNKKIKI